MTKLEIWKLQQKLKREQGRRAFATASINQFQSMHADACAEIARIERLIIDNGGKPEEKNVANKIYTREDLEN